LDRACCSTGRRTGSRRPHGRGAGGRTLGCSQGRRFRRLLRSCFRKEQRSPGTTSTRSAATRSAARGGPSPDDLGTYGARRVALPLRVERGTDDGLRDECLPVGVSRERRSARVQVARVREDSAHARAWRSLGTRAGVDLPTKLLHFSSLAFGRRDAPARHASKRVHRISKLQ
jgi:hypothetical protein